MSEHIVTDACGEALHPFCGTVFVSTILKYQWAPLGGSRGAGENENPRSHQPNGDVPMIEDNTALYRAGAADEPAQGVGHGVDSDSSSSDLQPWTYRSFPETDPGPMQRTLLVELLRLRECQRNPNDPACAERIARLRASINAYEEEERVRGWNPQHRKSGRSVTSSEAVAPSGEAPSERIPPLEERMSTPAPPGGGKWERWLNDGAPNPHVCLELLRLALIGKFPLPNRGAPRWKTPPFHGIPPSFQSPVSAPPPFQPAPFHPQK